MGVGGKGRPKKPTALQLVQGDRKDRINRSAPMPAELDIVPPAWMRPRAVAEWERLAPDLIAKGVLTGWDVQAFAEWCDAVATVAEAAEHLAADGHMVERPVFDRNGARTGFRVVPNEWFYIQKAALEVSAKRAARFGLTPAERSALPIDRGGAGDGQDPERFFI